MVLVALGVVAAVGACLRFVTSSPLWLDEALSVNIASLPLDEVSGALRRDGHPPLFYLLLHGWIAAVGDSDLAVRALSGLWAVALLPLVWIAGRRVGGRRTAACTVVILALSPFAVRYATEARMYAMVSVLALVGWLAADSAWRRPGLVPLAGVAVCSALLLWTHYWSIWFLAVGASLLAVLAWRANAGGDRAARSAALRILAAVGVGGLTFAPWLPTLWYQRAHTGTPWTRPSRPAEVLSTLASDLGGGGTGEAAVLGWLVLVLAAGGLWLRVSTPWELTADLRRPRGPAALSMAVLAGGTLVVGGLGGYLTGAGFASRYASVVLPFVVVLAATAVAELRPRALGVSVLGLIGLLSSLGLARNVTDDRSDAHQFATRMYVHGIGREAVGRSRPIEGVGRACRRIGRQRAGVRCHRRQGLGRRRNRCRCRRLGLGGFLASEEAEHVEVRAAGPHGGASGRRAVGDNEPSALGRAGFRRQF